MGGGSSSTSTGTGTYCTTVLVGTIGGFGDLVVSRSLDLDSSGTCRVDRNPLIARAEIRTPSAMAETTPK
jgi:hypothetical protein